MPDPNQLDTTRVAEIIPQQFPELSPSQISYLGEGCDSWAFDVDSKWVFRFPKRPDVEQQFLLEFRVLPALTVHSPLPLPEFCFHGRPSMAFPRHFGGYPRLPGVPGIQHKPHTVPFDAWAPTLAHFLSWLHAFPLEEAARLGVERGNVTSLIDEVRADALDDFECLNQVAPDAPLEAWHAYLTKGLPIAAKRSPTAALVHGDLAAEHVLCDLSTSTLTGVIDWSDMAIGDPALDLAGLFHWGGEPFLSAVLSSYAGPADETILERARFLAACRGVGDVAFGLETNRREYVDAGIRALSLSAGPT